MFKRKLIVPERLNKAVSADKRHKKAYSVIQRWPIWRWLQRTKLYDTYASEELLGSLGLDGSGRSLRLV